jgi:cytochrome c oxidase subunit 1
VYNFEEIPVVHSLDELWHRKYAEREGGVVVPVPAGGAGTDPSHGPGSAGQEGHGAGGHAIHLPGQSYFPFVAALGLPLIGYGVIFHLWMAVAGAVVLLAGVYGWAIEPASE